MWLNLIEFLSLVVGHHRAYSASTKLVIVVIDSVLHSRSNAVEALQMKIYAHVTQRDECVQWFLLSNRQILSPLEVLVVGRVILVQVV